MIDSYVYVRTRVFQTVTETHLLAVTKQPLPATLDLEHMNPPWLADIAAQQSQAA